MWHSKEKCTSFLMKIQKAKEKKVNDKKIVLQNLRRRIFQEGFEFESNFEREGGS